MKEVKKKSLTSWILNFNIKSIKVGLIRFYKDQSFVIKIHNSYLIRDFDIEQREQSFIHLFY